MSEPRGRKRKSPEKNLEQELELLKNKLRRLEEQMTSGAANADSEGNNSRDQASDACGPRRSSLDEGYTSSDTENAPKPLETVVRQIQENESHRQRSVVYASPKYSKDSRLIKSRNSRPSNPEVIKENVSRYKPPSPGPSHSRDVSLNPQTVSMQSQNVSKTKSSVPMVNNIKQVSMAQNHSSVSSNLPNHVRPNERPSSPPANNIHQEMAERLHSVLQNGLSKGERFYLQEKYKIPGNCTLMKAPILNPEVIPFMDNSAKKRDTVMLKYQDQLGTCMAAIAEGATLASRNGNGGLKTAMEHIHRGLHLLADLHHDQTRVRRIVCTPVDSMLKSFLVEKLSHRHHNFQDINHLFKRDDTVFGRNTGKIIEELRPQ